MRRADALGYDTPEREIALSEQSSAGNRLSDAACKVCGFVPRCRHEARFKTDFIKTLARGNGGQLEQEEQDALLSSLADLVHFEQRRSV